MSDNTQSKTIASLLGITSAAEQMKLHGVPDPAHAADLNSTLEERVARAIAAATGWDPDMECANEKGGSQPYWIYFDTEARAAIKVLRDEIKDAGVLP